MALFTSLNNGLEVLTGLPAKTRQYVSDVSSEVKKVSWPSRKEVYGTTIVVIITVFIFGFYLWVVDLVLSYGIQRLYRLFGASA